MSLNSPIEALRALNRKLGPVGKSMAALSSCLTSRVETGTGASGFYKVPLWIAIRVPLLKGLGVRG